MNVSGRRLPLLLIGFVLVLALVAPMFRPQNAGATQITNRALTLVGGTADSNSDGIPDGGSMPGAVVNHKFTFTIPTNGTLGSIKFEYCTVASVDACVHPTGLVTTSATLGAEDPTVSGFTINNATNGAPYIHRTAATTGAANRNVMYQLNGITNPDVPSTPNYTFFVRITTYTSEDTTGSPVDTGSVAAATSTQIVLTGVMPESLIFCTGGDISLTGGIPDCTTATSGNISFNQLFSPSDTAVASSKMSASTNALSGYSITVDGPTLTSGSNTIPALASASASSKGTGQFGMNLRLNTSAAAPAFTGGGNPSADVTPASNGTDLKANPTANYKTPDTFMFPAGASIAKSDSDGAGGTSTLGPTNSQIYTASYIVNVSGAQPAGTYSTTLTYICTATF